MNTRKKNEESTVTLKRKARFRRQYIVSTIGTGIIQALVLPALAETTGPSTVINNFIDVLFGITKGIGAVGCLMSLIQLGISFKSHDTASREQAVLGLFGSLLITFAKELLTAIGAM